MNSDNENIEQNPNKPDLDKHSEITYQSMIDYAAQVIKLSVILNGGALLSLLAFLSSIWSAETPIPDLSNAAFFFVFGLMFASIAALLAYITQLILYNERPNQKALISSNWPLHIGIASVLFSIIFFAIGGFKGVEALYSQMPIVDAISDGSRG